MGFVMIIWSVCVNFETQEAYALFMTPKLDGRVSKKTLKTAWSRQAPSPSGVGAVDFFCVDLWFLSPRVSWTHWSK